jgi:hypothetical protein
MESKFSIYDAVIMSRIGSTMEKEIMMRVFIIRGDAGNNRNK